VSDAVPHSLPPVLDLVGNNETELELVFALMTIAVVLVVVGIVDGGR
jgi:hypothetical protein